MALGLTFYKFFVVLLLSRFAFGTSFIRFDGAFSLTSKHYGGSVGGDGKYHYYNLNDIITFNPNTCGVHYKCYEAGYNDNIGCCHTFLSEPVCKIMKEKFKNSLLVTF